MHRVVAAGSAGQETLPVVEDDRDLDHPEPAPHRPVGELHLHRVAGGAHVGQVDDVEHLRTSAQRNTDDREEFFNQANARMLRTIDSHTNFVMLNAGRPAEELVEHFEKNNIFLPRPVGAMSNYVRVSLGTAAEMVEFWHVWDLLPPPKMSM